MKIVSYAEILKTLADKSLEELVKKDENVAAAAHRIRRELFSGDIIFPREVEEILQDRIALESDRTNF